MTGSILKITGIIDPREDSCHLSDIIQNDLVQRVVNRFGGGMDCDQSDEADPPRKIGLMNDAFSWGECT